MFSKTEKRPQLLPLAAEIQFALLIQKREKLKQNLLKMEKNSFVVLGVH